MRKNMLLLLTIVKWVLVSAQDYSYNYEDAFWPFEAVRKDLNEGKPYHAVQFLTKVDNTYIKNLDIYGQALMTALCFSGEIEVKDSICEKFRTPNKNLDREEIMCPSIERGNASEIIVREANKHNIMMINEAHLYPQHRVFVKSILSELYDLGYKHLCMEDLVLPDTIGNAEFPQKNMGYYIQESCMGDLVREALRLGFRLHAYDVPESRDRDSLAAENIMHIYSSYPKDKVLVYCGFSHNMEHRSSTCMASCFKRISGIDPLTVDQTVYCEREFSVYYDQLLKFYDIQIPSVLLSGDTLVSMNKKYCDIHIITPPTSYIKNRPGWLIGIDKRELREIDPRLNSGIVEVYHTDEIQKSENAIPVDVLIVNPQKKSSRYLALPRFGSFVCKYYDLNYLYLYSLNIS